MTLHAFKQKLVYRLYRQLSCGETRKKMEILNGLFGRHTKNTMRLRKQQTKENNLLVKVGA